MTPMTSQEREKLLSKPGVTHDDIDEYERLLSERMTVDPSTAPTDADQQRDKRIAELYAKLYPEAATSWTAVIHCPPQASPKPIEIIAFDLLPVRQAHPEHAPVIDWLCKGANPPYTWGVWSAAAFLRRHSLSATKRQVVNGLFDFVGETCEQRDQRVIEEMRAEILRDAPQFAEGFNDDFLRLVYELESAYYLVTYHSEGPATKVLETNYAIRTKDAPTKYHVRVLRSFGVRVKYAAPMGKLAARLTREQVARLTARRWVHSVEPAVVCQRPRAHIEPVSNYHDLIASRNVLRGILRKDYGETAYLATKSQPRLWRFGVYLRRDGLVVMVTLNDEEGGQRPSTIAGQPYAEFVSLVPHEVDGFPVEVRQWILDKSENVS